ncbi:MAG: DivIVA domain-containing protein, partial [Leuconostoc citreum]|nr:DivIVA domain-containing protein [Leuconostoc citreum]
MALTPDEILNHDFTKKGSRAYIASEVDAFLDQVNGDYEAIIAERDRFANEKEQLQVKVDELEAKREQVNQSIFVAQEAAERLKKDADAEVKKQLMHAQESATKIIS